MNSTGNFDFSVWLQEEVLPSTNFDVTSDYPRVLRLMDYEPW
jgi:hypothetical protein